MIAVGKGPGAPALFVFQRLSSSRVSCTWHLRNRRHRCSDGRRILVGDHKNAGAGGQEDKQVMFNVQCLVLDVWRSLFNTAI